METKQSNELNLQALKKQEKTLKIVVAILSGAIVVMLLASMVLMLQKGFSIFSVLPITFLPLLSIFFNKLKKIRAEIDSIG